MQYKGCYFILFFGQEKVVILNKIKIVTHELC